MKLLKRIKYTGRELNIHVYTRIQELSKMKPQYKNNLDIY